MLWPAVRFKMSGKFSNLCKSNAVSFSGLLRSSSTSESFSRSSSEISGVFGLSSYSGSDSVSNLSRGVSYKSSSKSSYVPGRKLPLSPIICSCTQLLCCVIGEELFTLYFERSHLHFSSDVSLLSQDVAGFLTLSVLPLFDSFFSSFSSFCFFMHTEVLCELFVSQNLQ